MTDSIWKTLSAIDCSDHIEQKGQFSYLAWTWAWAKVKEVYPESTYKVLKDRTFHDDTMEVRVEVTIHDPSGTARPFLSHTMWLPVLDFKNKPIQCPNAFDINTARMRCLVKCLAMFGLGHYIYAGESAPAAPPELREKYDELVKLVSSNNPWGLREFTEVNKDHMDNLFNMAPQGSKTQFKNDVRRVYAVANDALKKNLALLEEAVGNPDSEYSVEEIMQDMSEVEAKYVWAGMNEVLKSQVQTAMEGKQDG